MVIFQSLVAFLMLSYGFRAALASAIILPFLPTIFLFTDWPSESQGNDTIMIAVLCSALVVTLMLSVKYFDNRIYCFTAHVLLVIYWITSFAIIGIAFT